MKWLAIVSLIFTMGTGAWSLADDPLSQSVAKSAADVAVDRPAGASTSDSEADSVPIRTATKSLSVRGETAIVYLRVKELSCVKKQEMSGDEIYFRSFDTRTPSHDCMLMNDHGPSHALHEFRLWYVRLHPKEDAKTELELWEHDLSILGKDASDDLLGSIFVHVEHRDGNVRVSWAPGLNCLANPCEDEQSARFTVEDLGAKYELEVTFELQGESARAPASPGDRPPARPMAHSGGRHGHGGGGGGRGGHGRF